MLTSSNGNSFKLVDALYVLRIKINLLLAFIPTRIDFIIKFVDDKCVVHNLSFSGTIMASCSLR